MKAIFTCKTKYFSLFISIIIIFSVFSGNVSAHQSQSNATSILVYIYRLDQNGASTGTLCSTSVPDYSYGCTIFEEGSTHPYPYGSNPVEVNIENDYLLDVISQEMSPEVYRQPIALMTQAIASRSFVNYFYNNYPGMFNNSTQYQVFIPYRFEKLSPSNIPDNTNNPCSSSNLNENQRYVCNATVSRNYIAQAANNPNNLSAKALFSADIWGQSVDGTSDKPYLKSVDDPISTTCDANYDGQGYGFSQEGANRWVRGNQCALASNGDAPWKVRWTNEKQLLFHYYTGVHLRDENENRLSPENRWNLLNISWSGNCPPVMFAGSTCSGTFVVQNTGTTTWLPGRYALIYHGWDSIGIQSSQQPNQVTQLSQQVTPGNSATEQLVFTSPSPPHPGTPYRIRLEMAIWDDYLGWIGFSELEPEKPWPSYDINVCVGGFCKIYIPIVQKN